MLPYAIINTSMVSATLLTSLASVLSASSCSAFVKPINHASIVSRRTHCPNQGLIGPNNDSHVLLAEGSDGSDDGIDSFLSSLPSPEAVKDNIMGVRILIRQELSTIITQIHLLTVTL